MNLNQLRNNIEKICEETSISKRGYLGGMKEGIKQTIEAVDEFIKFPKDIRFGRLYKEWQEIKKLLSLSKTKKSSNSSFNQDCSEFECEHNIV